MSEVLLKAQEAILVEGYLKYFYDAPSLCPYGISDVAIYHQGQFGYMDEQLMGCFLARGFRRNSNALYTMVCPGCCACTPIRLAVADFKSNRNQQRVARRNNGVEISTMPIQVSKEKLDLMARFFAHRYPGRDNTPESYYGSFFVNSITDTMEVEYRLDGRLVGVAVVDVGQNWLNGVYFYFDPDEARRSPGIFNILSLIDFCLKQGLSYLYLGYFIDGLSAMSYKATFKPHELFDGCEWQGGD